MKHSPVPDNPVSINQLIDGFYRERLAPLVTVAPDLSQTPEEWMASIVRVSFALGMLTAFENAKDFHSSPQLTDFIEDTSKYLRNRDYNQPITPKVTN